MCACAVSSRGVRFTRMHTDHRSERTFDRTPDTGRGVVAPLVPRVEYMCLCEKYFRSLVFE